MDDFDCASFFDQIDDLLDFSAEDVNCEFPPVKCQNFATDWSEFDSFPLSDIVLPINTSDSDISSELSVPYEDMGRMKWLSNFVEDPFCGGPTINNNVDPIKKEFQICSPVSVLENSSSSSGDKAGPPTPETHVPGKCGRARSKRSRPATFNPRPAIQLISPTSSISDTPQLIPTPKSSSDSESFTESHIKVPKQANPEQKKKKKIKHSIPLGTIDSNQNPLSQSVRKCMHCEITKTPQWRAGPMGPKSLCNACGVRYKSGRLFPEYRPAASPTFVPSLHSCSHKKVVEMRSKACDNPARTSMLTSEEPVPNTKHMDYI